MTNKAKTQKTNMQDTVVQGVACPVRVQWRRDLDQAKVDMGLGGAAHNDNALAAETLSYDAFLKGADAA